MAQPFPQPTSDSQERPRVAVVICTKDRPDDLLRAIASVRASGPRGRHAQIVVVEESDTPTALTGVQHIHHRRQGGGFGQTRNIGVKAAAADYIVFFDDDCEAEEQWLDRLLAPLEADATVLGVAGAVLVHNCSIIGYAENILGFPGGGLRYLHDAKGKAVPTLVLSTCNCAYRREAFLAVGGCPEDATFQTPGGEDFVLAERVRRVGRCLYTPDAVIYHRPRGTLRAIFHWFMGRGRNEITTWAITPDPTTFGWFLIRSSWTLRLAGVGLVIVLRPQLVWLLPILLLLYYGAMLWRYRFARAYATHRHAWWIVPIVKFTMDFGAEMGRWQGLSRKWRHPTTKTTSLGATSR